jgi:hypothetical protein
LFWIRSPLNTATVCNVSIVVYLFHFNILIISRISIIKRLQYEKFRILKRLIKNNWIDFFSMHEKNKYLEHLRWSASFTSSFGSVPGDNYYIFIKVTSQVARKEPVYLDFVTFNINKKIGWKKKKTTNKIKRWLLR